MLKPSVTSAPTADMATLTVVQPLTLDRGKGTARPPGHCDPLPPSLPLPTPTGTARRARAGGPGQRGQAKKAFAPRAGYFLPLSLPATSPLPLPAALARPTGAIAGLWRPHCRSQPLAGLPPGRRLCWSGCAGTARRPGLGLERGRRKLAVPGEGACSRRPGSWRGSRLPASAAAGPRRKEVCPGAGGRWAVRQRVPGQPPAAGRRTRGGLCRGARLLGGRGGELPSAERARGAPTAVPGPGRSVAAAEPALPGLAPRSAGVAPTPAAGSPLAAATRLSLPEPASFSASPLPPPARAAEGAGAQRRLGSNSTSDPRPWACCSAP